MEAGQPFSAILCSAIGKTTAAPIRPATNVTEPITMAFATRTRPRFGLAVNVVLIMPRRYSEVMNSAASAITTISPMSEPL